MERPLPISGTSLFGPDSPPLSTIQIPQQIVSMLRDRDRHSLSLTNRSWYQVVRGSPFIARHQGEFVGRSGRYEILRHIDREMAHDVLQQTGYEIPMTEEVLAGHVIGKGSFGELWVGRGPDGYVAIKISRSPDEREAQIQEKLSGLPHLMPSLDYALVRKPSEKPILYQVMPLAGLGSLESVRAMIEGLQDRAFREELIFHITQAVLEGLAGMHETHEYHLDLKPANIVIGREKSALKGLVQLIDFGCAQTSDDGHCELAKLNYDRSFASPECVHPEDTYVDLAKIDSWRAGLTLLLLTIPTNPFRHLAFDHVPLQEYSSVLARIPELASPPPGSFEELLTQLLRIDPKERWTAQEALRHPWLLKERDTVRLERARARLCEMIQSINRRAWIDRLVAPKVTVTDLGYSSDEEGPYSDTDYVNDYTDELDNSAAVPINREVAPRFEMGPSTAPLPHFTDYISRPMLEGEIERRLTDRLDSLTVCCGNGGVGKSQLSLRLFYNQKVRNEHARFLWFRAADRPDQLDTQFVTLAHQLQLIEKGAGPEEAVRRVAEFLAQEALQEGKPFLIVFDNADKPEDLTPYLPKVGGHVLVTTRNASWEGALKIDVLEPEEATVLIEQLLARGDPDGEQLARELGYLPLGIVQACAYIRNRDVPISEYLRMIATKSQLLDSDEMLFGRHLPVSIAALWEISFDRIRVDCPSALDCLDSIAYLAPDAIPGHLLDAIASEEAVASLLRYSLIEGGEESLYSAHRLLQTVVRNNHRLDSEAKLQRVTAAMLKAYQGEPIAQANRAANWQLVPHMQSLISHCDSLAAPCRQLEEGLADTLTYLGHIHRDLGQYIFAQRCCHRALEIYKRLYGLNDPNVASQYNNYGKSLRDLGDPKQAKECFEAALRIDRETFGRINHRVAVDLTNLGNASRDLAELSEAKRSFVEALEIDETLYPPDDPHLVACLGSLGHVCRELGEFEAARAYYERVLRIDEGVYGSGDPRVATHLNNLGNLLRDIGKLEEAQAYFVRALKSDREIYGPKHPRVGFRLSNLGSAWRDLGKGIEAKECFEEALAIVEEVFGFDHAKTATCYNNLGSALRDVGEFELARENIQNALDIDELLYEEAHPTLAIHLLNLGLVLRELGELKTAEKQIRRALKIDTAVYGVEHPNIAIDLNSLGFVLHDLNELQEAKECQERARKVWQAKHGESNLRMGKILSGLGLVLLKLDQAKEAQNCFNRALSICKELGHEDHPDTAHYHHSLALSFQSMEDLRLSQHHAEKAYEIAVSHPSMGPDHPRTREYRSKSTGTRRSSNESIHLDHSG